MTAKRLFAAPWFPFLIASYPIWHLYGANALSVQFAEVSRSLIVVELGTLGCFIGLRLVLRDDIRSSLITSCAVIGLFSYGHVRNFLRGWANHLWSTDWFLAHRFFLFAWLIAFAVIVAIILRKGRTWNALMLPMNVGSMALVVLPLTVLAQSSGFALAPKADHMLEAKSRASPLPGVTDQLPDIYYIILDGYGRADMLRENYGFDNSGFLDFLRNHGFYVADASQANFNRTFLSLATSLNMDYPHPPAYYLPEEHRKGRVGRDQDPEYVAAIDQMINDNAVLRYLQEHGYTTVQLASGTAPTDHNPFVDIELRTSAFNRFETQLVGDSILSVAYPWLWRHRILGQFATLVEIPRLPGPKFVFAHIVSPHPPFLFDRDGKMPPLQELGTLAIGDTDIWGSPRYIDQLVYVNHKMQAVIESILTRSAHRPIIIVQGDHGPGCFTLLSLVGLPRELTPAEAAQACMRSRMAILNAYYLPDDKKGPLYPEITPVNSFRVIFNQYLNGNYDLVADRSYVFSCGDTCEYYQYGKQD